MSGGQTQSGAAGPIISSIVTTTPSTTTSREQNIFTLKPQHSSKPKYTVINQIPMAILHYRLKNYILLPQLLHISNIIDIPILFADNDGNFEITAARNELINRAAPAAEFETMSKKYLEECIKEGNLSAEDTALIRSNELFSLNHKEASDKLQCYQLCFYTKIGIIDAAGNRKPDMLMEYLEQRVADKMDKIKPALDKCDYVKSINPCEMAYKYEECVLQTIIV